MELNEVNIAFCAQKTEQLERRKGAILQIQTVITTPSFIYNMRIILLFSAVSLSRYKAQARPYTPPGHIIYRDVQNQNKYCEDTNQVICSVFCTRCL